MIDLSYKKPEPKPAEEPIGLVIVGCIPFALLFYAVLTAAFLAG